MARVSRRNLLRGAGAALLPGSVPAASELPAPSLSGAFDQVRAKAAQWISDDQRRSALELEWQRLETLLFQIARQMQIECDEACLSELSEAGAMRALDKEIRSERLRLEALAAEIEEIPSATVADAIAKIELGLKLQGPCDWRENALELMERGIAEFRSLSS